jgi:hypothetical protein
LEPVTDTPAPAAEQKAPAPEQNGAAAGHKVPNAKPKSRNIRYPVQMRVNLTFEMAASLARIAQYREMPEGIVCREILKQYLLQNDGQYRADIGLIARNQNG